VKFALLALMLALPAFAEPGLDVFHQVDAQKRMSRS
jgi:hypothetical protein